MKTNTVMVKLIKQDGYNFTFEFESEGFAGKFRLFCENQSKGKKENLKPLKCYFEGLLTGYQYSGTYDVQYVTDAMLFIERHMDWILGELTR